MSPRRSAPARVRPEAASDEIVQLHGGRGLRAHVLHGRRLDVAAHQQALAHRDRWPAECNRAGRWGCRTRWRSCRGVHARRGRLHVVVDHDLAVRQHVHLALEQVGVRQEADGQNRHFGRVLALFGDHSDGVVVIVAELDHLLAERERDAVLLERGRHLIGDGLIEIIGQRAIKAVDQRGLDAGDAELLGDFRGSI